MASPNTRTYFKFAFFSAFTNIPVFENPEDFFRQQIRPIFDNYKKGLALMSAESERVSALREQAQPASDLVYLPVPYCLFGDFDIAVFSLIDDFSFASKKFKPMPRGKNFKYQVNTGIIPNIEIYNPGYSKLSIFQEDALPGFFTGADFYPFTGITSIKLNNSMMIGIGQQFIELVNFHLVLTIDRFIETKQAEDKGSRLFYIINENLGWNELTVYFFANSLSDINEIALLIRESKLGDILSNLEEADPDKYDTKQTEAWKEFIRGSLGRDSLLFLLIAREQETGAGSRLDFLESHFIVATSTVFGYHPDNTQIEVPGDLRSFGQVKGEKEQKRFKEELDKKMVSIYWNVKPGHEGNASNAIRASLPANLTGGGSGPAALYENNQPGKFSFVFPAAPISLLDYFSFLSKAYLHAANDFIQSIVKFKSRPFLNSGIVYEPYDEDRHYKYKLEHYKINDEDFEEIRQKLRIHPIPHTIKGQVENLVLNFNDAVTDPLMYNYFIGLKFPLLNFLKDQMNTGERRIAPVSNKMDKGLSGDLSDFGQAKEYLHDNSIYNRKNIVSVNAREFISFIETWNKAYWNRHFHGYYFTEINDFNIEHHGGIQQILFTYDVIYKIISKRIYGEFSKEPFVSVRIDPVITSTSYNNTINFTHLFRPAVYAIECVHEAANFIIPYLVRNCNNLEYSFLLNPKSLYDEQTRFRAHLFEQGIKQSVGSKDGFEVEFIEQYFGLNSIRYLFTDYLEFMLAYNFDAGSPGRFIELSHATAFDNLLRFYHTHWYLYLTRADLYLMNKESGSWYFNEEDFKFLFIRCNLMFYLMCGFDEDQLDMLNEECPSVELNVVWTTQKKPLLAFVLRLGEALREEFKNMGTAGDISLENFTYIIRNEILEKKRSEDGNLEFYEKVITLNDSLIRSFYDHFRKRPGTGDDYFNSVTRDHENKPGLESNIGFYDNHTRQLFLDPKGNIFSTAEAIRKDILATNIAYLKNSWDIAMKAAIAFYKSPEEQ